MAPDAERIGNLPTTWRTMTKNALTGFDKDDYERYSFPVPAHPGLDITEIPFILKKFPAILESILLDMDDMQHGNFWFGDPKGRLQWHLRSGRDSMKILLC